MEKKKNTKASTALTFQQEKFCQELFALGADRFGSLSRAYRKAYNCEGMKQETVWSKACILAKQEKVRARIEQLQNEAAARYTERRERNERILDAIINAKMSNCYEEDEDGNVTLRDILDLPENEAIAVVSISANGVKLADKVQAIKVQDERNGWSSAEVKLVGGIATLGELEITFGEDDET